MNHTPSGIPHVVLGTMTFGGQVDEAGAARMIVRFREAGHTELDTAFSYCEGRTEEILGRIAKPEPGLIMATKANPWGSQGLRPERVVEQVETSLRRMNRESVDILYLHAPDLKTPLEQTLEACQRLHQAGRFRELGMSNYAAWQVADACALSARHGWVRPTVYQGMYNAITRDVERELFPCLRNYGIRFYAYNPLAGGLLTGKHSAVEQLPDSGRFHDNEMYQTRYWKSAYFQAVEILRLACEVEGIAMADAAQRWLNHHSLMAGQVADAIIVGASSLDHLSSNLASCAAGPLPEAVVRACDEAWEAAQPHCPRYFRT